MHLTYSAFDGSEGEHVLSAVAAVSAPGLIAGIISFLQDELLTLKLWVLITHPAAKITISVFYHRKKGTFITTYTHPHVMPIYIYIYIYEEFRCKSLYVPFEFFF